MTAGFGLVLAAFVLFAATNIDDLLLLVAIHSDHRRSYPPQAVLLGQVLGFSVIVLISLIGFWFNVLLPQSWLSCLGIFPLLMGCSQLVAFVQARSKSATALRGYSGSVDDASLPRLSASWRRTSGKVAALTLANGSDNISVYLPAFSNLDSVELVLTLIVFYFGLLTLWLLSNWLAFHPRWQAGLRAVGPVLAPMVLIALGLWLISESVIVRSMLAA